MSQVELILKNDNILILFQYDPLIIEKIKQHVIGRKYDKKNRCWYAPKTSYDILLDLFPDAILGGGLTKSTVFPIGKKNDFPLQEQLLKLPLKPFQREGALFLLNTQTGLLGDETGLGKAQPLDSLILTPDGWITMGSAKVGQKIMGCDGNSYTITGVHPQGVEDVYKVTFSDLTSAECSLNHLWKVIKHGNKVHNKWEILSTQEIINCGLKYKTGQTRFFLPQPAPMKFTEKEIPIDPYLLGVLIGDGCCSNTITVSSADSELIEEISYLLPKNVIIKKQKGINYDWSIVKESGLTNPLKDAIRLLKLNVTSKYKFIPEIYKFGSIEQRVALVQGLLDTDGYIDKEGVHISFATISKQLAEDFAFVVKSLGGRATIRKNCKTIKFAHKIIENYISYNVTIIPSDFLPFRLNRKLSRYRGRPKYKPHNSIVSVDFIGKKETQCISVNAPDRLYITDNVIPTHNTIQSIAAAISVPNAKRILVLSTASTKIQWQEEIKKFTHYDSTVISGDKKKREQLWRSETLFLIANHELLLVDKELVNNIDVLIIDEASAAFKNYSAKRTKSIREIVKQNNIKFVFSLTATSIENSFLDLHSILYIANANIVGNKSYFLRTFCDVDQYFNVKDYRNIEYFLELIKPLYLARSKEEILPPRNNVSLLVQMGEEQKDKYDYYAEIVEKEINAKGTMSELIKIVRVLRLREICDHPRLLNFDAPSAKIDKLVFICRNTDQKVIVFTSFSRMADIIESETLLQAFNPLKITGKVKKEERQKIIELFSTSPDHKLLIMTDAGTYGLNITAASIVINFDLPWNSAKIEQRVGRAWRIGQERKVTVISFIAENSVDGKIQKLVNKKKELMKKMPKNKINV